jgi:HTH-type transcriptional regulator/antitoxin MqsA
MRYRACANCGAPCAVPFEGEAFRISHKGVSAEMKGLSGRRCSSCGEVEFDQRSAKRYAAAGDKLVLQARSEQRSEIRVAATTRSRDMSVENRRLCPRL